MPKATKRRRTSRKTRGSPAVAKKIVEALPETKTPAVLTHDKMLLIIEERQAIPYQRFYMHNLLKHNHPRCLSAEDAMKYGNYHNENYQHDYFFKMDMQQQKQLADMSIAAAHSQVASQKYVLAEIYDQWVMDLAAH